ncbi:aldose epimerase family protein [Aporhodopirellula aestuarii]|uniref:Aldose 1-epimerase n=1 Tax=Aporhodopirellula aestuarii TaxID=2950107 RepID=A0ABT0U9Y9_9BACT|nr:aldose epimerase family protein [Aporhodopirellula aestuarii]MCM2373762.1 galactose mutarotase [Aporhodopirellula aestuarii]
MSITTKPFGQTEDGAPVTKITLTNRSGNHISVMNWGASLLEVVVPDRDGQLANVNLVFDSIERYLAPHPGFGSTIGRFCNRIGQAKFTIDGVEYPVTANHGKHCLHGGSVNFSHHNWTTEIIPDDATRGEDMVRYTLVSPDGEEGFPGELTATTLYRWNDANELTIEYTATTTKPTHVNLTNHSYWNLGGVDSGSAVNHEAIIHGEEVLAIDDDLIPTGELVHVENTPFDFRRQTSFAARIQSLQATKGYDHCYVVDGPAGTLRPAAHVVDPVSGRGLAIETTLPAMQLYTANHLKKDERSGGYGPQDAFCLETQYYPDAPNHPNFPTTLLRPGAHFHEKTVHRFTA